MKGRGGWRGALPLLALGLLLLPTGALRAAEQALQLAQPDYPVPAILALPDAHRGPVPAVLLLHGMASQKNEVGDLYRTLAARLAGRGIASLRIDFAGSGDSAVGHERFHLSGAVRDAATAIAYLRALREVDGNRIAVVGFSQGGLVAQRTVLGHPEVDTLLTWSTAAADGAGDMGPFFQRYAATARREGVVEVPFAWLPQPLPFSARWFDEMAAQQTLTEMARYAGPVFAIAGLEDETVPYAQSIALVRRSAHPSSRVLLLAGADHTFNVLEDPVDAGAAVRPHVALLDASVSWLGEQLSAAPRSRAPAE